MDSGHQTRSSCQGGQSKNCWGYLSSLGFYKGTLLSLWRLRSMSPTEIAPLFPGWRLRHYCCHPTKVLVTFIGLSSLASLTGFYQLVVLSIWSVPTRFNASIVCTKKAIGGGGVLACISSILRKRGASALDEAMMPSPSRKWPHRIDLHAFAVLRIILCVLNDFFSSRNIHLQGHNMI